MIQIMAALASGSSRLSRFSQRSAIMTSYLPGYFRKMSLITTTASCTTYGFFVLISSSRASTQRVASRPSLTATWPMALTDLRTTSMSTSDAYSRNSESTWSMFFSEASCTMTAIFSSLTYRGSLYLQTNMRISDARICGCFWTMMLMFRITTYWISGSAESSVTSGGVIFLQSMRTIWSFSSAWILSMNFIITLMVESTTALFPCDRRTMTPRSRIVSATLEFGGLYIARASRMKTWPHSEHSFRAGSSLEMTSSLSCR
mmetsp:Transcript_37501/g.99212  ORF Transcript_37501/g.99212 Transcript_37501/m.99212 type:complete len:260 (+) Transcript_37501:586-1365(+)